MITDPGEMDGLPAWMRPLANAAHSAPRRDLAGNPVPPTGGRRSAVLILFGEDGRGPNVLITERSTTLSAHAGQPAFPGGRIDPSDRGPVDAALREAREETGLDPAGVRVVATLPERFLAVNSSAVTPVLGWWRTPSPVRVVDPGEVASVHVVPITELVDPANRLTTGAPGRFVGPAFLASGLFVWGFTATLLDLVLELGEFARPWDKTRFEPLPERVVRLTARDRAAAEAARSARATDQSTDRAR